MSDDPGWQATLHAAYRRASALHPHVVIDEAIYTAHVITVGADLATLAGEHVGDLLIASAVVAKHATAETALAQIVERALGQMRRSVRLRDDQLDEVRQLVLLRLVGGGSEGPPALLRYSGRGPLAAYVQIVAARLAFTVSGAPQGEEIDPARLAADVAGTSGVERLVAREQIATPLKRALGLAIGRLEARARLILRLHYVHDRDVAALAQLYSVDRSTMSRWLTRARADLWALARPHLMETLGSDDREVIAAIAEVVSQLDLSLSRLLADD